MLKIFHDPNPEIKLLKSKHPEEILDLISEFEIYNRKDNLRKVLNFKIFLEKDNIINSQKILAKDIIFLIEFLITINQPIELDNHPRYLLQTIYCLTEGVRKKYDGKEDIEKLALMSFIKLMNLFKTTVNTIRDSKLKEDFLWRIDYLINSIIFLVCSRNLDKREKRLCYLLNDKFHFPSLREEVKKNTYDDSPGISKPGFALNNTKSSQINNNLPTPNENNKNFINEQIKVNTENVNKSNSEIIEKVISQNHQFKDSKIGNNNIFMMGCEFKLDNMNIGNNNAINVTNKIKFDLTKNFNKPHKSYFEHNKSLNKNKILSNTKKLMESYYIQETKAFTEKYSSIEIEKFIKYLRDLLKIYEVHSIGSAEYGIVSNYPNRTFNLDMVLVSKESFKDDMLIRELESNRNGTHKFNFVEKGINQGLNFILKDINCEEKINMTVFHQEIYKDSNSLLKKIFKLKSFKELHVFLQEIFFKHYKISWTRYHISCFIVAFLIFKFPDFEKINTKQTVLKKLDPIKKLGKKQVTTEEIDTYWYDFKESELNSIQCSSELLFEFLDFLKRFFIYYKDVIQSSINSSYVKNKDLEEAYLKYFQRGMLTDQNYIFNLNFLIVEMTKKQNHSLYSPLAPQISKLLFSIIENSDKLSTFKNIIDLNESLLTKK